MNLTSKSRIRYKSKVKSRTKRVRSQKKDIKLVKIITSPNRQKKYRAVFIVNGREKNVDFGARGYQNFGGVGQERHLDEKRKRRYLERHKSRENWNDPTTPGALSRWILWNKPTFRESVSDFKRRFRL